MFVNSSHRIFWYHISVLRYRRFNAWWVSSFLTSKILPTTSCASYSPLRAFSFSRSPCGFMLSTNVRITPIEHKIHAVVIYAEYAKAFLCRLPEVIRTEIIGLCNMRLCPYSSVIQGTTIWISHMDTISLQLYLWRGSSWIASFFAAYKWFSDSLWIFVGLFADHLKINEHVDDPNLTLFQLIPICLLGSTCFQSTI